MLLRCVFISSILVLVAARDFNNRFDTRDSIVEAEMSYLQAREEYIEGVKLLRRLGGQGTCSVSRAGTVCLRIGSKNPCGRCPIGALKDETCMCDVTYIEPQPTNPSGGGTPAVRRPLVAGLESEGKCLPRGISEALRCTERGRDGNFNTHCDNVCDAGAEEGSYCICRRSALSKKRDARHKKTDNQSGGDSPQNPTKKRKQDGASGGRTPAKIQKL